MSASERDSRALDDERRRNDKLLDENARLREELGNQKLRREQAYRRIRDIMGEPF